MSIRTRQNEFTHAVALLILHAHQLGYTTSFGDTWSKPCPVCGHFGHKKDGKHPDRLAIDINLFWDGVYLDKTEHHEPLGLYWESIGGIWGGRFKKKDGNHYEWSR